MKISELVRINDLLIAEAEQLLADYMPFRDVGKIVASKLTVDYASIAASARVFFTYLNSETYLLLLDRMCLGRDLFPDVLLGILKAAKRDFANGLLIHPRIVATADSMADILDQAEHLLLNDYHVAACVLVGGAMESTLRTMWEVQYKGEQVPKPSMNEFNQRLHKASAYDAVTFRQISAYGQLRNNAAHGKYDEVDKPRVEDFLRFTREFIMRYFAPKFEAA
ncbi:MAG: hypothetical protein PHI18_02180 [bacterium]|nr:hypothetical protein [bacterium]